MLIAFLKHYQHTGRFPPNKFSIPKDAIQYIGEKLSLPAALFYYSNWAKRTTKRYRSLIRVFLGFSRWQENCETSVKEYLLSEVIPNRGSAMVRAKKCHLATHNSIPYKK